MTLNRRFLLLFLAAFAAFAADGQDLKFTEASDLTLVGKIMETPNPYHRVDTVKYKGFTAGENNQIRSSSGLAVVFRTNSSRIVIQSDYGYMNAGVSTTPQALWGFDLYIKKDGEWLYAESGSPTSMSKSGAPFTLIDGMDNQMKECMLYLPLYSELHSCKIGVDSDAKIEGGEAPFRHRIGVFGSSYTHGISCSRSGMAYPAQLSRATGLQFLSLGCSGNCRLQPYFADVLKDCEVDAFLFDAFSNPSAEVIEERLFPFIERVQEAHPDIPLIFQQTIYRERRNFDLATDKFEADKQAMAAKLMKEACRRYENVYFIQTNATDKGHTTSVDATHPGDYGYSLWAESIRKPVVKILKKYGIK